ncbi:MAG: glutamate decarboxylase [Bacillota bacterium]|jgi:hypothetical protein
MWKVIYIAPNRKVAEKIEARLSQEGLMVRGRPVQSAAGQQSSGPVEISVPKSEAAEALEFLSEFLCELNRPK